MTRTATRLVAAEMSPPFAAFRFVPLFIEFDPQISQPIANPGANYRRILSDVAGEHQRVQSAERCCKSADPFLDLIAEQRVASAAHVSCVSLSIKSCMSELVSDIPSSPDW
jgi:hypothetical protein